MVYAMPNVQLASESGEKPQVVVQSKKHKEKVINCDDACLGWKAQRICTCVLAAVEIVGLFRHFFERIRSYITKIVKLSQTIQLHAVTHGLSKGTI